MIITRRREGERSFDTVESAIDWINPLLAGEPRPRVLLTFHAGANRYRRAATRLSKAWCALGDYYYALILTLDDLRQLPNVSSEDWNFVRLHEQRAHGFWIWKPLIIDYFAQALRPGTQICYIDAGCEINAVGRSSELLGIYWNLAAQQSVAAFESDFLAHEYTKADIYQALDLKPTVNSRQLAATCVFLLAGDQSAKFCSEWLSLCRQENYHLIDDSPSVHEHDSTTLQNRFDQSVLSALYTKHGLVPLPNEIYFGHGYWRWRKAGKRFPIWASRNTRGVPLYAWRTSLAWLGWLRYEMQVLKKRMAPPSARQAAG